MKRSRSLSDMVRDVEQALHLLDEADDAVASAEASLERARTERAKAVSSLAGVRDALFKEYPELAGSVVTQTVPQEVSPDTGFAVIEVDDADDPRYTAGVGPGESGDVEFQERA